MNDSRTFKELKKKLIKRKSSNTFTPARKELKDVNEHNNNNLTKAIPTFSHDNALIDQRCRYWIENRISQLLMSDNFTTRGGYSFTIDNDRSKPGLCFRFMKNGTTIARIDSNGYLYCANVFANGVNLANIANIIQSMNDNSSIYVKHADLTNGEYVMDIDEIVCNKAEVHDELKINNSTITSEHDDEFDVETMTVDNTITVFNGKVSVEGSVLDVMNENKIRTQFIEQLQNILFINIEDMVIDFKKRLANYNDRARIIYTTDGDYNNTLSLDINKSHTLLARVYSDGEGSYFSTIKHIITLLNGEGQTKLLKLFVSGLMWQLNDSLAAGSHTSYMFGKGDNIYEGGNLCYNYENNVSNSYISMFLNGMSGLNIYGDRVESQTPFSCPQLTVNGTLIDEQNIAYINKSNTFTKNQIIQQNTTDVIKLYNTSTNGNVYVWVGNDDADANTKGAFGWIGNSTADNRCTAIWCRNTEVQRWYKYKTEINKTTYQYNGFIMNSGNMQINSTDSGGANNWNIALRLLNSSLISSPAVYESFLIGYDMSTRNCALISYKHTGTSGSNDNHLAIGQWGYSENARFYGDRNELTKYTKIDGKLETTQTTPNNAFDTNMKKCLLQLMYPVGSVYMSATSHSNPNDIFGVVVGTWVEINDNHYLLASNSSRTLRQMGASDFNHTHGTNDLTLNGNQIPSHNHQVNINTNDSGWHNHLVPSWKSGGGSNARTTYYGDGGDRNWYIDTSWGGTHSHNVNGWSGYSGGNLPHNHGSTHSGGSWGPYYRVHMWYRSA